MTNLTLDQRAVIALFTLPALALICQVAPAVVSAAVIAYLVALGVDTVIYIERTSPK